MVTTYYLNDTYKVGDNVVKTTGHYGAEAKYKEVLTIVDKNYIEILTDMFGTRVTQIIFEFDDGDKQSLYVFDK